MRHLVIAFTLLVLVTLATATMIGCGGEEVEPTVTPARTAQSPATSAPPATATPVPTVTAASATPAATSHIKYIQRIPEDTLSECAQQFVREYEGAVTAYAYQSSDKKAIFLPFSAHWSVPIEDIRQLADQYIRLVKSKVDTPPGKEIGTGNYDYVTEVTHQGGLLIAQGTKCAECSTISWD
jgi:hypothetical protein